MIGTEEGRREQGPDETRLRRSNVHVGPRGFRELEHFGNVVVGKQHYRLTAPTISSLSRNERVDNPLSCRIIFLLFDPLPPPIRLIPNQGGLKIYGAFAFCYTI